VTILLAFIVGFGAARVFGLVRMRVQARRQCKHMAYRLLFTVPPTAICHDCGKVKVLEP
jgi:hypothetical protein